MSAFSATDHAMMARALRLAERGAYTTRPNPMVGCVLAHGDEVVGEGWHRRQGEPHAEVLALQAAGDRARGATAYVTLEPCAHTGRTGPCADALVAAGVARVVAAMRDPFPQVDGSGFDRLRTAGIAVEVGLMEAQARALNVGFVSRVVRGRPWVRVKLACSLDGRTAMASGDSKWITGEAARADVMHWRARAGAILTGAGTVLADDPSLTVRFATPREFVPPLRVVLDSHLRLPWDCRLITVPEAPTMIVTTQHTAQVEFQQVEKFRNAGVEVLTVRETDNRCDLAETLAALGQRGVQQVLIEAGPTLLAEFLRQNLADEVRIYIAPLLLGANGHADISEPLAALAAACKLNGVQVHNFGVDVCFSAHIGSLLD